MGANRTSICRAISIFYGGAAINNPTDWERSASEDCGFFEQATGGEAVETEEIRVNDAGDAFENQAGVLAWNRRG